ncbi:GNAT family N-acetyltransferase [Streptomyces longwoodensis]|uniref:GNAT family N-acetyltransferase n=1 Tax=Streptomyces longwoodensis TaxID=68231 RepID=UPI00324A64A6
MIKYSMRAATSADAPGIVLLLAQIPSWQESNVSRWREDLEQYEQYGLGARRGGWLIESGGAVIAVLTVEWKRPRTIAGRIWPVYLEYLVTDEKHRSSGHGSRLVRYVVQELVRRDCRGVYLKVFKGDDGWSGALRFWESHGWTAYSGLATDTHVVMTKEIVPSHPASGSSAIGR